MLSTVAEPAHVQPASMRSRRLALYGISVANFAVLLDMAIVPVAEADLARSLGASVTGLQWIVTGFTITFGAFMLSAGSVADRYGAHRAFRTGVIAFAVFSVLCAVATNLLTLVVARGLLGVAAAVATPAAMALIARLHPSPAERVKAVATWAAISGVAFPVGPVLGGVLVEAAGWRAIFIVNLPIAALALVLTAGRVIRCPTGEGRIRWPVQISVCVAVGLLADAIIAAGTGAETRALVSATIAVACACIAVFVDRRHHADRVFAPEVLRAPGFASSLLAATAIAFALASFFFAMPLVFLELRPMTPTDVGLALLPMTIPLAVMPRITDLLARIYGVRLIVLAGLSMTAAGALVIEAALGAGFRLPSFVLGLLLVGLGVSLALPILIGLVVAGARPGRAASAGAMLHAVRMVGGMLGVAVVGAFVATGGKEGVTRHLPTAMALVAAVCLVGCLGVLLQPRRGRYRTRRARPAHRRQGATRRLGVAQV